VYLSGSLLLLAASLHAPTAYAAPGDPPSGSPAGAVYQLPLQQGRADAAPKGGGGTGAPAGEASGGGSGGEGEEGSLYRTENNFGSSSEVPGAPPAGGSAGGGGGSGDGGGGAPAGGRDGSSAPAVAGGTAAADVTDSGNTSVFASLALLGGITLLGVAVGLLSRRFGASQPS
jgi:hypothetical protein